MAEAAVEKPDGVIRDVIFPVVIGGEETLRALVRELKASGSRYRTKVHSRMRSSYGSHYRRLLPRLLAALEFRSNNDRHRPVLKAVELLRRHADSRARYYPLKEIPPIDGIVPGPWREHVVKETDAGERINRIAYELCVLERLREGLRTKEIWVVGALRFRNPDEDLPLDFARNRETH